MLQLNLWHTSGHRFSTPPISKNVLAGGQWSRLTGAGLGLLGEQGVESIHARSNTLHRTYHCMRNKVQ